MSGLPELAPAASSTVHLPSSAARRDLNINRQILRAVFGLMSGTLLIRAMGMVKQVVISPRFGAGVAMDAYFVASGLPLTAAGIIMATIELSVIPTYARAQRDSARDHLSTLFSTLLNLLLVGAVLFCAILFAFRRQLVFLSAPALDPTRINLALYLWPLVLLTCALMVVGGLLESVLNAEGWFALPATAGALIPLTIAVLVMVAGESFGIAALCWGMVVGTSLQIAVLSICLIQKRIAYRLVIDLGLPEIRAILAAAWPMVLGASISQAAPLIDQAFASSLSVGGVSALEYALKIMSMPNGVVFASLGRAALPYLSRQAVTNDIQALKGTLRLYLWIVTIGTLAGTLALLELAHPVVAILFQRGAFTSQDALLTANTLRGFLIGLVPMAWNFLLIKAFGALGKTRVTMYIGVATVSADIVFDAIFIHFWQAFGIALATSIVSACSSMIFLFMLRREIGSLDLLTLPPELSHALRHFGRLHVRNCASILPYARLAAWKRGDRFRSLVCLRQTLAPLGIMCAALATGIASSLLDPLIAVGLGVVLVCTLAFLRYPYLLVIAWALVAAFVSFTRTNLNTNPDELLIPATLVLLLATPTVHVFRRVPGLAVFFIYLLWVLAGIGISPVDTVTFMKNWLIFLTYVGISVLTVVVLTARHRMEKLISALLLLSTLVAGFSIYAFATHQFSGLDASAAQYRVASVFTTDAPTLALLICMMIPLVVYRSITCQGWARVLTLILVALLIVVVGLTLTRSAFISLPLSVLVMAFCVPSFRTRLAILGGILGTGAVAIFLAVIVQVPLFARFMAADVATANGRTIVWNILLSHLDLSRLLGTGLNGHEALLDRVPVGPGGVMVAGGIGDSAFNVFLGALFDHGVVGASLLVLVFVILAVHLVVGVRRSTGDQRVLFAAVLAVYVNFLVQNLDAEALWVPGIGFYFWLIVALPFAQHWLSARPKVEEHGSG
jgi:murein biosynthesis integral membrane protein MurJ